MKQIFIGTGSARILGISKERINYADEAGAEGSLDLFRCSELMNEHFKPEWKYVGFRNAARPNPYATFNADTKVRFIFNTYEAIYAELLIPLREAGWRTVDLD